MNLKHLFQKLFLYFIQIIILINYLYLKKNTNSLDVFLSCGLLFQFKTKQLDNLNTDSFNDVLEPRDIRANDQKLEHPHRLRHNKMVHAQIARLARSQDQLDEYQQNLQTQILDVQRRLDRVEEPNWNLVSARVDFLEIQSNVLRDEIKNVSLKISDFDKVHASMLELREDVESIENKADKTIPEFRKEISKLDVSFAQVSQIIVNVIKINTYVNN